MRIFTREPNDWKELQNFVGQMFTECNFETEVSKTIDLVRGSKEIDVYTQDVSGEYKPIILVECKYWSTAVNQEVVHSFRTVINDFGANIGFIVSRNGFQSGCYEAAEKTNVKLVSLQELEEIYHLRWRSEMVKKYAPYTKPLYPYWDYTGRMPLDGKPISYDTQLLIRKAYAPICDLALSDYFELEFVEYPFKIPTINDDLKVNGSVEIKNDREYFDFCEKNKHEVLRHFKILFREQ